MIARFSDATGHGAAMRPAKPGLFTLGGLLAWFALTWAGGAAAETASWRATTTCAWVGSEVECRFRPLAPVKIERLEWAVEGETPRAVDNWLPFAPSDRDSAVLWLVDVSNPARAATLARQQDLLRQWLALMTFRYRLGIAAFAEATRVLAPLGSTPAQMRAALGELNAHGQSTAFYRSLLDGVELLKQTRAERKSLWVFSDGLAEDTAYRHEDVAAAARAAGVVIIGLGYPERDSLRPQLQRLQRLAEETEGYFVVAPTRGNLPDAALEAILAVVDGGGKLTLSVLEPRAQRLTLRLVATQGSVTVQTIDLPAPVPDASPAPAPPSADLAGAASPAAPPAAIGWARWPVLGWGFGGAALLVGLGVLAWRRRPAEPPPLARFETLDTGRQWLVRQTPCRIGRSADNDLRLANDSVSLHHAELQQRRDGSFSIADLGSTNGIWLNGKRVNGHPLRDGDVLEFGEVRLRFREVGR